SFSSSSIPHTVPTSVLFSFSPLPPRSTLFPYTTLFRSSQAGAIGIRRRISPGLLLIPWFVKPNDPGLWIGLIRLSVCASATSSRSEEHTSELQSRENLVCRLLLEKKKQNTITYATASDW